VGVNKILKSSPHTAVVCVCVCETEREREHLASTCKINKTTATKRPMLSITFSHMKGVQASI
jgi:hypothetical protein